MSRQGRGGFELSPHLAAQAQSQSNKTNWRKTEPSLTKLNNFGLTLLKAIFQWEQQISF